MSYDLQPLIERALGDAVDIVASEPVSGGDISEAVAVATPRRRLFVKWQHGGPPDIFEREAEALERMWASGTDLRVPEVFSATRPGDGFPATLVIEYIESGRPAADYDERFGRGLAQLHSALAEAFGFDEDNYCGTTPQPNGWTDDWVEFYLENRLRHQLELIEQRRGVSTDEKRAFEDLLDRLDELLEANEPPSLIHGDLWSGNAYADTDGRPVLVDPAAYYGHPEAEIGMMELFGGFGDTVYAAYEEVREFPDGWRKRVPLYSLYHLLNHYYLFGGHYGRRAFEVVERMR